MFGTMGQTNVKNLGNGGTIDGDLTISGDLTVSGGGSLSFDEIIEGTQVIDITSTEAFLVRKNGDGGDLFTLDTTNSRMLFAGEMRLNDKDGDGTFGGRIRYDNSDNELRIEANEVSGDDVAIKGNDAIKFEDSGGTKMLLDAGKLTVGSDTSPTGILHIAPGSGSAPTMFFEQHTSATDGTLGEISFGNRAVDGQLALIQAKNDGANDSAFLAFHTEVTSGALTERMRISSDGKVGININPTKTLDIEGIAEASTGIRLRHPSDDTLFEVVASEDDGRIRLFANNSRKIQLHANDVSYINGGNLGIGTETALSTLVVRGANAVNPSNGSGGNHTLQLIDTTSIAQGVGGGIAFGGNFVGSTETLFAEIRGIKENSTSHDFDGALVFSTRLEDASIAERMRLTSAGQLGIGETAPVAELHIKQGSAGDVDTHANVALILEGSGDTLLQFQTPNDATDVGIIFGDPDDRDVGAIKYDHSSGNDSLKFTSNGSLAMTIDSSQRVGIGDSSPAKILSVKATGNDDGISLKNSSGQFLALIHQQDSDAGMLRLYDESSTTKIAFNADSGESSYFNNGGNVGIGVTAPDKLLTLGQDATDGAQTAYLKILDKDTDTTANTLLEILWSKYHTGTDMADVASIGGGIEQWSGTSSNRNTYMDFRTVTSGSRTEKMRIDSSGDVGIGTQTPNYNSTAKALTVLGGNSEDIGSVEIIGHTDSGNTAVSRLYMGNRAGSQDDLVYLETKTGSGASDGVLCFYTSASGTAAEAMRITSDGQVGIGTGANIDELLHVQASSGNVYAKVETEASNSSAGLRLVGGNNDESRIHFGDADDVDIGKIVYIHGSTNAMVFTTNTTEHFRIASNGDLTATDTVIASNSDERLKENIQDYSGGLDIITKLRPVTFEYKDSKRKQGTIRGFVAQEVKEVDDYWIGSYTIEDKIDGVKNPEYEYVKDTDGQSLTSKISAKDTMYVSAIQELLAKIDALEVRIKELESK